MEPVLRANAQIGWKMDLVNVLVDPKHLRYVWNLQGKLAAHHGPLPAKIVVEAGPEAVVASKPVSKTAKPAKSSNGKWTPEFAARAYRESRPAMKGILRLLAENPDVGHTTAEVARAAGHSKKSLRSILGAFGHRCKSRYGIDGFCFASVHDGEIQKHLYTMHADIAEAIRAEMAT